LRAIRDHPVASKLAPTVLDRDAWLPMFSAADVDFGQKFRALAPAFHPEPQKRMLGPALRGSMPGNV